MTGKVFCVELEGTGKCKSFGETEMMEDCLQKKKMMNLDGQSCGLGSCHPRWLQKLANTSVFTLVFAFIQVIELAYLTYFQSVISTLEREFGVQTQTVGIVMTGNEVSQILVGLALVYIAGKGNRPRWLAIAMLIVSFANLILVLPLLLDMAWGHLGEVMSSTAQDSAVQVCPRFLGYNGTSANATICDANVSNSRSIIALTIIFGGQFVAGTGFTMLNTLTLSYLDDNVKKSVSPLYIGIASGLKLMGPVVGSMLGSFCLRFFVRFTTPADISYKDPRWIGAWWLGFLIFATLFFIGAIFVAMFPESLPNDEEEMDENQNTNQAVITYSPTPVTTKTDSDIEAAPESTATHSMKDFKDTMKRLLKNKILLCHAASRCFHLFGTQGYSVFQPKYLESNFRQTASGASFFTGMSGSMTRMVGILFTGLVLRKWKPKTSYVTGWNLFLDAAYIGAMAALMTLSCSKLEIVGFNSGIDKESGLNSLTCSDNCDCSNQPFNPICLNNKNYFSPCRAGCQSVQVNEGKQMIYSNCSCGLTETMSNDMDLMPKEGYNSWMNSTLLQAIGGYCQESCPAFQTYLIIIGATKLVMATRKVGRLLITLRSVEERDKSVALALYAVLESLFAYIPSAVIYGAVLDKACILWGGSCGKGGHCWIYDTEFLRIAMHMLTIAAFIGGTLLDCVVLYQCRSMALFGTEETKPPAKSGEHNDGLPVSKELSSTNDGITPKGRLNHEGMHVVESCSRITID